MNLKPCTHPKPHRWVQPALAAAALVAACFGGSDGNRAPVIETPAELQVLSDEKTTLTIQASDPDGDAVRLDAQGLPPFAQFHDNGDGSATIVVDAVEAHHGTYLVTFTATDDASTPAASTQQFPLRVRSKALVQSCAGTDTNIRAQARPLSACRSHA